jgi:hypothetical protein
MWTFPQFQRDGHMQRSNLARKYSWALNFIFLDFASCWPHVVPRWLQLIMNMGGKTTLPSVKLGKELTEYLFYLIVLYHLWELSLRSWLFWHLWWQGCWGGMWWPEALNLVYFTLPQILHILNIKTWTPCGLTWTPTRTLVKSIWNPPGVHWSPHRVHLESRLRQT